ncbi:MAG: class I SAM-dependent methyltransferase [Alteromonadaceae bacterium]|nr:class I SAM-dependent methyltransferase [Alteromonadaceae bacterium]
MLEHITTTDFSECQRLFHGRGHGYANFSHVNVDWLPPVVLITIYQEVENDWLCEQAEQLKSLILDCESVQVQYRCRQFSPSEVILGEEITHTIVPESGLLYHIELGKAQNTGLFLDMKNGRDWVRKQVENKNVLNLFSYTCAFSVAALAGGAEKVVNVDLSKASLNKGRDNHRLNRQDTKKVVFEGVDIFKSYGRLKKYGPYDLLICDPPSFQKGSVNIERDYRKIMKRIPQLVKPDGQLMMCLNSPDLDAEFLLTEMARECPDCQYQTSITPPEVFKEAHAGKGLKVLIFKYIPA